MALNRKIACIDLSKKKIDITPVPSEWRRRFIGGRGLDAYLLYQHMPAGCDPLKPGNPFIISAGLFGGTTVSDDTVTGIAAKSPLTNHMVYSTFNGLFASEMRWAGFDYILINGRSKHPVYLYVHNGAIEIRDAGRFWGQNIPDTQKDLCREISADDCRMICIGPAGENKVRFANITSDRGDTSGSTGLGAVLGSKNVKAIVCTGTMDVEIKHPKETLKFRKDNFNSKVREGKTPVNIQKTDPSSKVHLLCHEYGLDFQTVDTTLNWVFDLYEQGKISVKKTNGLQLNRNNPTVKEELISQIASKEGFGKILAEGPLRAAKKLGKNALDYFDSMNTLAGIYMESKPGKSESKPGKDIGIKNVAALLNKNRAVSGILDNLAISDSGDHDLDTMIKLIELNTGKIYRKKDLLESAYRSYAVERLLGIREDDAAKDTITPESVLSVPEKTVLLDHADPEINLKHFKDRINKYYNARHWNKSNLLKLKIFESIGISDLWPLRK